MKLQCSIVNQRKIIEWSKTETERWKKKSFNPLFILLSLPLSLSLCLSLSLSLEMKENKSVRDKERERWKEGKVCVYDENAHQTARKFARPKKMRERAESAAFCGRSAHKKRERERESEAQQLEGLHTRVQEASGLRTSSYPPEGRTTDPLQRLKVERFKR